MPDLWIDDPVCQIFRSQIVAFAAREEPCGVSAGPALRDRMVPGEQFPGDGAGMRNAEDDKSLNQIRILPGEQPRQSGAPVVPDQDGLATVALCIDHGADVIEENRTPVVLDTFRTIAQIIPAQIKSDHLIIC